MAVTPLSFGSVNDAINDIFFDGRFSAQPVYLSMDNGMRSEFAERFGIDPNTAESAICDSVRPTLARAGDPYARYALDTRIWKRSGMRRPPPFSALLFSLAYAAELMEAEGDFANSNYYYRLSQVTGIERDILKRYRNSPEPLWLALNDWLVANNHLLGRPTARPMSSTWRYVGWSISQAIVRASDRDLFHDLFEGFGFSGSEAISKRDMVHYLANWMLTSRPNARLKNAWSKRELRERVAEAAIAELASWNSGSGTTIAGTQARATRLSLLANLVPRLAGPVLELHLGHLGEEASPATLVNEVGSFQIANDEFGNFATISPSPFLAGDAALGQLHAFKQIGSARRLEWQPRLVVPFAKPEQGALWVEATRVGFGVQHLLLVRDTGRLPKMVESYLMKAASRLPTIATAGKLKGLPAGWILYGDVQISRTDIHPDSYDLECLVPFGEGSVLDFQGGLQLLPSFYHSKSSPVARLAVPAGPARLEAAAPVAEGTIASTPSAGKEVELRLGSNMGEALVLRGYEGEELVEETEVFFRDADNPTPLHRDGRGQLEYASILSTGKPAFTPSVAVRGMSVAGEVTHPGKVDQGSGEPAAVLPEGGAVEDVQDATYSRAVEQHVAREACIENGYHVWRFPMIPADTPRGTPVEGRCTSCSQSLVIVYRQRKKVLPAAALAARIPLPPMPLPTNDDTHPVDHDLLLDALSFFGSGSWSKFVALLDALTTEPQFARQVAEEYAALGLVDVELRPGSSAIRSWSVPAPAINFFGDRQAFLSGFRSGDLVQQLQQAVVDAGGKLSSAPQGGGPSALFFEGIDDSVLRTAIDGIHDPHGRQVAINVQPALSIAGACLAMPPLEQSLVPVSIGRARNLQQFNPQSAHWKDVEGVRGNGCYRWNEGSQAYAYVGADGTAKGGPYQITKLLAARASRMRLHAYDASKHAFRSTLGCEPPGLLSRALVACSGRLPARDRGITIHTSVTPEVGLATMKVLYGEV
ncbi:hypothetical protein ACFSQQ_16570 [Mesorhizobium kowhaii]|uniref:hypothetical protein n=1 Tax=Mesorhizobium kowhaii TaxID=1300272 RepID=UPI0035F058E3